MSDVVAVGQRDQAVMLDVAIDLIEKCRGNTARDMNRAIDQAAKMIGTDFKKMQRYLKIAHLRGSMAAIRDQQDETLRWGPTGSIYFAYDDQSNRIKIGFSANPEVRIQVVSRLTGIQLREIARFNDCYMLNEHVCHVLARPALLGGEWYDADHLRGIGHFKFLNADLNYGVAA